MKKKMIPILLTAVLLAAALLTALFVRNSAPKFTGSRVYNPDCYMLDFQSMNGEDSHTLHADVEQVLCVEFEIQKGTATLTIRTDGLEPVFQSDNLRASELNGSGFILHLPVTGDYTIELNAKRAAGYLHCAVQSAP